MAWTEVETIIANPARKRGSSMARHLSAKQIAAGFGGKRRKSAARKRRPKAHRQRSNPVRKAAPRKRRAASHKRTHRAPARRRSNPGQIISLLPAANPGRRKRVARTQKKRKAARRHNASRAHHKTARRRTVRHNPGQVGGLLKTGLSVIAGAVGSKVGAQAVLGSKNVGIFGYLANAAAGGVLAWAAKAFMRDRSISQGIVIGTVVQIITRAIGDFTPYGSLLSGAGMGDYMVSNFAAPQRLVDGLNSPMVQIPAGWGGAQVAIPAAGMSSYGGDCLYTV